MMPGGVGIRRLHHVAILTRSIDRSVDHYADLFGVERPEVRQVDKPGMRLRTAMIPTGPTAETCLQLIEPEVGPGVDELARGGDGAVFEIAFEVDDIEAAAEAYRSAGTAPLDLPGRAIETAYLTSGSGTRYFYLPIEANLGTRTEIVVPSSTSDAPVGQAATVRGDFVDRVAIVTGGASGIGAAVVRQLAAEGARVAIFDLQVDLAEQVAAALGGTDRVLALSVDVTNADAVRAAVQDVLTAFGTIDVAVNCAGLNRFVAPEAVDDAMWRRILAINLDGPWNVCSAVMPEMIRRRRGRIVNIGSAAGVLGIPKAVPYSTAKHGVVGLTRALAVDLGPYGITVNCVAPGTTLTPLVEAATTQTFKDQATDRTPLARLGTPDDLAAAVLFLASDRASWITGVVLPVDGGMTAVIRAHHWE